MLPLLLNVVHWYFSKSSWQFYGGKGWKEEMGKVFIKTDVLGRPHWGIGEG